VGQNAGLEVYSAAAAVKINNRKINEEKYFRNLNGLLPLL
jgi:hypothetical protein